MQFLRRNRFALLIVAVSFFSAVMVVQQHLANQSAHAQQVEDFLLLHERGETKPCEHLHQVLVQRLPHLNDRDLVQDLQRTAMVVDAKAPQMHNLVWKYHVSVRNELKHRAEKRLEAIVQGAVKE
jgi:hypothetical protein